jgi:hypothetical protein
LLPFPSPSPSSSCYRCFPLHLPLLPVLVSLISLFLPRPSLVFIHSVPPSFLIMFFLPPPSSSCFYSYISFAFSFSFVFLPLYCSCSLPSHLLGYVKSDPVITTSVYGTPRL